MASSFWHERVFNEFITFVMIPTQKQLVSFEGGMSISAEMSLAPK